MVNISGKDPAKMLFFFSIVKWLRSIALDQIQFGFVTNVSIVDDE